MISKLAPHQTHDPQRGSFRVGVKESTNPTHYSGERVYEDAFGSQFTVSGPATRQPRVRFV